MTTARVNMEDSGKSFSFETEAQAATKDQKQKLRNKLLKTGGILILCLVFLNFVLIVFVMKRTSELSTEDFSAVVNQTDETEEIVDEMKFDFGVIEKWRKSTEEKFESHQLQIESLQNRTKIDKQLEALENENAELKISHGKLKELFDSLSKKFDQLESKILSDRAVSFPTAEIENNENSALDLESITSCSVAMETFPSPRSKKQRIYSHGNTTTTVKVLCDFETDGGGWTIIQKRSSGPKEEFNRSWNEYQKGFGSLDKNFWLGLDTIRALTKNGDQELKIELEDFEGERKWAKYSNFSISDASDFYRLTLGGFYENSTLSDSMAASADLNNGMRFSTKDQDNDNYAEKCTAIEGGDGGWWFNECGYCNLNGLYFEKEDTVSNWNGIWWHSWKSNVHSLAKTEMKIRNRK